MEWAAGDEKNLVTRSLPLGGILENVTASAAQRAPLRETSEIALAQNASQ